MFNAQEILLALAWVRKNATPVEDQAELLARKLLDNRIQESQSKVDYWQGQTESSEKALDRLDKMRAKEAGK